MIALAFFARTIEFLVKLFRLCDLHGQLCIASVMLAWHVSVAWIALCAIPCEGLLWSSILLILMALPHIMGIVHAPMLLA